MHTISQVEITYHVSWRRSRSPGSRCPEADGRVVTGENNLVCHYGCSGTIAPLPFRCTRVSVQDDWVFGVYSVTHNFGSYTTRDTITVGTTGCCFVPGGRWNVSTTFSLARRSGANTINSTPRTSVDPVIRVQAGCTHRIVLPVHDPDGDIVRCRWASGRECSGICNQISGATLEPDTCTITYTANRWTGYRGVAIMVEDFTPGSPVPLSTVALQFFVRVVRSTGPCPPLIPAAGECVATSVM